MFIFVFKVIVFDKGFIILLLMVIVMVKVIDENDVVFVFLEKVFLFKVLEQKVVGIVVGRLIVRDFDDGVNGEFEFYVESGIQFFEVVKDGVVKIIMFLDREKQEVYDFIVFVMDKGQFFKFSLVGVKIIIDDENDNSFKFVFFLSINNIVLVF